MTDKRHIVVVDDEPELRELVEEYLELNGYQVTTADGGDALRRAMAGDDVDLVLLDLNMPGEDGLTLTRWLRDNADVGIIMLTAASETVDRVVGLEMGADDYVAKPFDLRELLARIKSVMRRVSAADAPPAESADATKTLRFGRCSLHLKSRRLADENDVELPLTSMEYDLLTAFARHPNQVLTRDQLLNLAHNRDWDPFDRSIDVRINRLRKKIERDPAQPQVIKTVRGAGYMYVSED